MKNKNLKELNYNRDLEGLLNQLAKFDCINSDDLFLFLKSQKLGSFGKCAICGGFYVLDGNSPEPIVNDDVERCCSYCNDAVVVHIYRFGISFAPSKKSNVNRRYYSE